MKYLMRYVAGAVLAVGVGVLGGCHNSYPATETQNAKSEAEPSHFGFIRFAENMDGGGQSCAIPIKEGRYNLKDKNYACDDDVFSYFSFDAAPSAVRVRLHSDFNTGFECNWKGGTGNDWTFDINTTKNPTTTGWISIASLRGQPEGTVVTPGVRMGRWQYRSGDIEAELECVSIHPSPLP